MANEFIIKNGFHSKGDSQITGSLNTNGTITMTTASIGGGIFTSASLAAGGGGGGSTFP